MSHSLIDIGLVRSFSWNGWRRRLAPMWTMTDELRRNGRPWPAGQHAVRMFTILGFGVVEVLATDAKGQFILNAKGDQPLSRYVFGFFHFERPRR